jgi:NADH dehydrogenase [ubiquinone] 1 alpha subcomplex assembly factor 7
MPDPLPRAGGQGVGEALRRRIAAEGPISVADYMEAANAHYYATRDPLGAAGDFVTAPEISQMFGELVGLWLADLWMHANSPEETHYAELGPGRGTLAADALRAMRQARLRPDVHLIETSPVLRRAQAERLPGAHWHDRIETLPESGPLLIVANEFFDSLPVHQYASNGRELRIGFAGGRFVRDGDEDIIERSPVSLEIVRHLAGRLRKQGGAALIIDQGHVHGSAGDTLQAVSRHRHADPFENRP